MAMAQNPNRIPSEHPNPATKIGPKMGGEFTSPPKWDQSRLKWVVHSPTKMGSPKTVLTTTAICRLPLPRGNGRAPSAAPSPWARRTGARCRSPTRRFEFFFFPSPVSFFFPFSEKVNLGRRRWSPYCGWLRNPFENRFETMGRRCLLVFPGESSCQGFLGGAGFRPSTVSLNPRLFILAVVVKTVLGSHVGVGFTTHFRTYFSGDWDAHWGYDLDFDPWPYEPQSKPG